MSSDDFTSDTGMTAEHTALHEGTYRVAPTDGHERFNAIRIPLVPVACWRLNDPAFAFDSSFVGADVAPELAKLAALVEAHPGCPASIFGHADPTGSDEANKVISDRRAIAIYAVLTRRLDQWENLYVNPVDGDAWGIPALQTMLSTIEDGSRSPYYTGTVDGDYGALTTAAVKRFQTDAGLVVDGRAGRATRKLLFGAYMDQICTDRSGERFLMKPDDFLGGGADAGGKMALQGCGRFNPVVLLPRSEEGQSDGARNADNAPNRRVLVFLFKPRKTSPDEWPCPRVGESADGCRSQLWPDGESRRQNGEGLRLYEDSRDTMACRFYDRFARRSPCEGAPPRPHPLLRARVQLNGAVLAHEPYRLFMNGARLPLSGETDDHGDIRRHLPMRVTSVRLVLPKRRLERVVAVEALEAADTIVGAQRRLRQLGYYQGDVDGEKSELFTAAVCGFQEAQGLSPTGEADPPTVDALRAAYGC